MDIPEKTAPEPAATGSERPSNFIIEEVAKDLESGRFKYVRTRLEESYPGAWDLRHGPAKGGWQTIITVKEKIP